MGCVQKMSVCVHDLFLLSRVHPDPLPCSIAYAFCDSFVSILLVLVGGSLRRRPPLQTSSRAWLGNAPPASFTFESAPWPSTFAPPLLLLSSCCCCRSRGTTLLRDGSPVTFSTCISDLRLARSFHWLCNGWIPFGAKFWDAFELKRRGAGAGLWIGLALLGTLLLLP